MSDSDGTPTYVSGDANSDGILQSTETWLYSLPVTPPAQNAGSSHSNAAATSGTYTLSLPDALPVSQTISYTDVAPAIQVVKGASVPSVREGGVGGDQV